MEQQLRAAIYGTPRELLQRLVDEALRMVSTADGATLELLDPDGWLTYLCSSGTLEGSAGVRLRAATSLSGMSIEARTTLRCDDSATDPRVDRAMCERLGIRSMVCVPLQRESGAVGVLKLSSQQPGALTDRDVRLLDELAEFISTMAVAATDLAVTASVFDAVNTVAHEVDSAATFVDNVLRAARPAPEGRLPIERLLQGTDRLVMVCQPIYELESQRVVGVEALARFPDGPVQGPEPWFAEAHRVGLGIELELLAVSRALSHLPELPNSAYLAVNVGAEALLDVRLGRLIEPNGDRVVVELTEHDPLSWRPEVTEALDALRSIGVRIATDDTGAGFSGLTRLLEVQPEIIKLDRALTIGIETHSPRLALVAALTTYAAHTSTQLIAEGIETDAALDLLRSAGVVFGQGYALSRPAPFEQFTGGNPAN